MDAQEPIFSVKDKWGDEIALRQEDWDRITSKRPGVEDYLEEVRKTLEGPTRGEPGIVYEGRYVDTKVFYKMGLLDEDPFIRLVTSAWLSDIRQGSPRRSEPSTSRTTCREHLETCFTGLPEGGSTLVTFAINGKPVGTSDYDEVADILYLWVAEPRPAVTYETTDGHLVQLDPESRALLGVAIVDYRATWEGKTITFDAPVVEQHVLELVGA